MAYKFQRVLTRDHDRFERFAEERIRAASADDVQVHIQATSNDSAYTGKQLWGMYGDATNPVNAYGSQAGEAWAAGTVGSTRVAVGVIDSGIDYTHPDLYLNIWLNYGEIPSSFRGALRDTDGDTLITFRDLNASANAGYVTDLNVNGRIDAGDLLADARWEDRRDGDGNGYVDDLVGWDFQNNDNDPFDDNGHGTHAAGTIGAIGGNGVGVAGVNWAVQMVPLKFLNASGSGATSYAVKALDYFTNASKNPHGVDFVATNNSWGGGSYSQSVLDAIGRGAARDILFVAAAGNGGSDTIGDNTDSVANWPSNYNTAAIAGYDSVISVAAITSSGARASFSNYGRATVDLGAPGAGIYSTLPGGRYGSMSGTSMATPHVTGAVALYAAAHPGATAAQIKAALLGSTVATASLNGLTVTGGRLDVHAMLGDAAPAPTPAPAPAPTPTASTINGTSANDILNGTSANDTISGFGGNDVIKGAAGADRMVGGAGNDTYVVDNSGDAVVETAGQGYDTVHTGLSYTLPAEVERLYMDAATSISGTGNALANSIIGGGGANTILGLGGNDTLWGNAGNDRIEGGDGDDRLYGGAGVDSLTGGAGRDIFDWDSAADAGRSSSRDTVRDFVSGQDRLDFSGIDAIAGTSGNDAFRFIAGSAFTGHAGELHFQQISGGLLVQGDTNGDRIADFEVLLSGTLTSLQTADVVL